MASRIRSCRRARKLRCNELSFPCKVRGTSSSGSLSWRYLVCQIEILRSQLSLHSASPIPELLRIFSSLTFTNPKTKDHNHSNSASRTLLFYKRGSACRECKPFHSFGRTGFSSKAIMRIRPRKPRLLVYTTLHKLIPRLVRHSLSHSSRKSNCICDKDWGPTCSDWRSVILPNRVDEWLVQRSQARGMHDTWMIPELR